MSAERRALGELDYVRGKSDGFLLGDEVGEARDFHPISRPMPASRANGSPLMPITRLPLPTPTPTPTPTPCAFTPFFALLSF